MRRSRLLIVALFFVAATAGGALFFGFDREARRTQSVVPEFFPGPVVMTSKGLYTCSFPAPSPYPALARPDCHPRTKLETRGEAERKRLMARPEVRAIREYQRALC